MSNHVLGIMVAGAGFCLPGNEGSNDSFEGIVSNFTDTRAVQSFIHNPFMFSESRQVSVAARGEGAIDSLRDGLRTSRAEWTVSQKSIKALEAEKAAIESKISNLNSHSVLLKETCSQLRCVRM